MATTDRRQPASLALERIDLDGGVRVSLNESGAVVTVPNPRGLQETINLFPLTRQQANRMSIALKKAARRLQAIGATLPEEAR